MYLYCANIVCLMYDLSIREISVNVSGEVSGIINRLKKQTNTALLSNSERCYKNRRY